MEENLSSRIEIRTSTGKILKNSEDLISFYNEKLHRLKLNPDFSEYEFLLMEIREFEVAANFRPADEESISFQHSLFKYLKFLKEKLEGMNEYKISLKSSIENISMLEWKGRGSKTELATLIYALSKTGRITVKGNGQPATMEEIKIAIETLFNTSISNINELVRTSLHTYKRTNGEKLFTEILNDFIKDYKEK